MRQPPQSLRLLFASLLIGAGCAAAPTAAPTTNESAAGIGHSSPDREPSSISSGRPCGGTTPSDGARPPTPVLIVDETVVPGVMGLNHRWTEGGVTTTGDGVYPRPADVPAVPMSAGAELSVVSPADAELTRWRIVGLFSSLWPGPSDEAVVLADSSVGGAGPSTGVCFSAPGAGDWMIQARVDYVNGRGNGNFFWHLQVE